MRQFEFFKNKMEILHFPYKQLTFYLKLEVTFKLCVLNFALLHVKIVNQGRARRNHSSRGNNLKYQNHFTHLLFECVTWPGSGKRNKLGHFFVAAQLINRLMQADNGSLVLFSTAYQCPEFKFRFLFFRLQMLRFSALCGQILKKF